MGLAPALDPFFEAVDDFARVRGNLAGNGSVVNWSGDGAFADDSEPSVLEVARPPHLLVGTRSELVAAEVLLLIRALSLRGVERRRVQGLQAIVLGLCTLEPSNGAAPGSSINV